MSCLLAFLAPIFLSPAPTLFLQLDEAITGLPPDQGIIAPVEAEEPPPSIEPRAEAERPTQQEIEVAESINSGVQQREDIRVVHRAFGIATWLSMGVSTIIGAITYSDQYGTGGPGDTPCAHQQAVLSQDYCYNEPPMPMLISGALTSVLYYSTFTLSFLMPDPLGVAQAPGWQGERLRIHQALRWAHLVGMVLTTVFGAIGANLPQPPLGDTDFETLRAFGAVHLALGATTYALLTAAAAVILF